MQNNQWEIIGDHLLTKSPVELKDKSIESTRTKQNRVAIVMVSFYNLYLQDLKGWIMSWINVDRIII